MKWFRMYSEVLHDPKVQKLSPALFKSWVNLLCLANDSEPRGTLPPMADVAFALRLSEAATRKTVEQLCDAGLFDDDGVSVTAHGWENRQKKSDNVTERVTKYRAEHPVSETLQKRTREEERRKETEQKREEAEQEPAAAAAETEIKRCFDAWFNATGTTVTAQIGESIADWCERVSPEVVLAAIEETGRSGARAWKYTNAILQRWETEGRGPPVEDDSWESQKARYSNGIALFAGRPLGSGGRP